MHLSIRFLGLDLLTIDANTSDETTELELGEATSYPVGFTQSPGDQAWEQGVER